jgi:hypothetical protein
MKKNRLSIGNPFSILLIIILIASQLHAQIVKETWELVNTKEDGSTYVNSYGLDKFDENDDIYVWVLEEHSKPNVMEGIDVKIYKTKTYFLLNKFLKRYSIMQIIFYDVKNNVIKNYNYARNMENLNFKYSSPILEGSDIEEILLKCVTLINEKHIK